MQQYRLWPDTTAWREVGGGGYGHYLHHAHFEVNYGTVKVPLDRLFGSWTADWPRSKSGAAAAGLKEYVQISVPANCWLPRLRCHRLNESHNMCYMR